MSFKFSKELAINVGLAFVAGFASTLGAFTAATPKPPSTAVVISAVAGAAWAGVRAAVGFFAANANRIPTIPVDE